ncbi:MAG: DUF1861 family protein [Thermicanus sp.]|nr:DUF1861 family protein [Thermicanus sp.]
MVESTRKGCRELVEEMRKRGGKRQAFPLEFAGVGDRDVYNITAPFEDEGEIVIAGRVERRESEASEVYFFENRNGEWTVREGTPSFRLQDPFFTRIGGQLIFGGVETFPHPTQEGFLWWRTVFYKGKNIRDLQPFFKGPEGMKDLRLVELRDGSIGILTRPQGGKGGRGKIGFTTVSSLDLLSKEVIEKAPLLPGQFLDEEWGGSNELHLLSNGLIGVLGHIACFDEAGGRHYYPMVFSLDPMTRATSPIYVIAERGDFLEGPAKRPDLTDVVFSGGIIRNGDGTAILYAGISDAGAQMLLIEDPFLIFEK